MKKLLESDPEYKGDISFSILGGVLVGLIVSLCVTFATNGPKACYVGVLEINCTIGHGLWTHAVVGAVLGVIIRRLSRWWRRQGDQTEQNDHRLISPAILLGMSLFLGHALGFGLGASWGHGILLLQGGKMEFGSILWETTKWSLGFGLLFPCILSAGYYAGCHLEEVAKRLLSLPWREIAREIISRARKEAMIVKN